MTILLTCVFCLLLILVLATSLNPQRQGSGGHMINASWLDSAERFRLITRWGAQL